MSQWSNNPWQGFLPKKAVVMARFARGVIEASQVLPESHLNSSQIEEKFVDSLALIQTELGECPRCKLCKSRKKVVVGEGNPNAELVFVGVSPDGADDQAGRPFVGESGQLLERMIEAIGLKRDQVFLTNGVKCRTPGDRPPEPDEIATCGAFLERQLGCIRPKVIVALGEEAITALLGPTFGVAVGRGNFVKRGDAQVMPTFHPSHLVKNPAAKREAWADLQKVARELGIKIPPR